MKGLGGKTVYQSQSQLGIQFRVTPNLQQAIRAEVEQLAAESVSWQGTDGCGAPVPVMSLAGLARGEMVYNKEKLLALGGTHPGIQKWKHKLEEAKEQETFPVKV